MMIIAEIGINHNGSMDNVFKLMDMAKGAGADMVKFQKRTIDVVYDKDFLDSPRESPWGTTQRHQKMALELNSAQYGQIDEYSHAIGLPWFASAWDVKSLEFLDRFDCAFAKVASAMITNCEFLKEVAKRRKYTFISTGMVDSMQPIRKAVAIFQLADCPYMLMHCVGKYPCPPEDSRLKIIQTLKEMFPDVSVGFSSHAVSPIIPGFAALLSADAIECHITLDRSMYGSDQSASLEREGLKKLVDYSRMAVRALGDGVKFMDDQELINAEKLRYWE
jgi:N-acetylneuraminate synthase